MTLKKVAKSVKGLGRKTEKKAGRTADVNHATSVLKKHQHNPVASVAGAIVVKDQNLIFLSRGDGWAPVEGRHGYGLYFNDCRFLRGYEVTLCEMPFTELTGEAEGERATFELTNPTLRLGDSDEIGQQTLGCRLERRLDGFGKTLTDEIVITNRSEKAVHLGLRFSFASGFEDIFVIRGAIPKGSGRHHSPVWSANTLCFAYDGVDEIKRTLNVSLTPGPDETFEQTALLRKDLPVGAAWRVKVKCTIGEMQNGHDDAADASTRPGPSGATSWKPSFASVLTNSGFLNRALARSFSDLVLLTSKVGEDHYLAAGIPWYATLFGRDSLISAIQVLPYEPKIARQTLRLLAKLQGRTENAAKAEQPGKICHELRVGEAARSGQIPYTPYYGTIDATPLFLILFGQYFRWSGDRALVQDLLANVERALEWMDLYGDRHGTDYVRYAGGQGQHQLGNQGWKDSGDAIMHRNGELATAPIALVEVQGYAYLAKIEMAHVYDGLGDPTRARELRNEAALLKTRINHDFWMEDKGCYALALDKGDRHVGVISSNAGQLLWSGAADVDKARLVARRLLQSDCFSGWGVRTLSNKELRFNPVGYHLGTVWPHDNSVIAAGFRNYGHHAAADQIFKGIAKAALHSSKSRLPEVFSGFSVRDFTKPVSYPVACHPQAWAAGALPFLLYSSLGLQPAAIENTLRVVEPRLPAFLNHVTVRGLHLGQRTLDLSFVRKDQETVSCHVLKDDGAVHVISAR